MPKVFTARVKSVISGDTIILAPLNKNSHQERLFSLAGIQAPRLQSNEKYAFESRELLRKLLLGKQVRFWVVYKTKTGEREFGDVSSPVFSSLVQYVLEKGGARLRPGHHSDGNEDDDDSYEKLVDIESQAKKAKVGLWADDYVPIKVVDRPAESQIDAKPIASIVERVISGDRIIARLLLGDRTQCVIPVLIAGVRTPRTANGDEPAEPLGDSAKNFVEQRLQGADVKISLLGESSSGVLVGKIVHPSGNISDRILQEGLGQVADWQSEMVGVKGMSVLRKDERSARQAGKGLWKAKKSVKSKNTGSSGSKFHATVCRVISADTLELRLDDGSNMTVQLAYLRGSRQSDEKTAAFVSQAREFVRRKVIGKQVECSVEFVRPATEQYQERQMVTIAHGSKNLSQDVVSSGYATVLRHRNGEEELPDYWDELIELESQAKKSKAGMFGKAPEAEKWVDASETAAKAKPYLFTLQNRGKFSGVVDYIMSPTRYRINVPREGIRLVLVLGGLANRKSRDDEISKKAMALATDKALQRDVSVEVYGTDRIGSFIGNLYLPGSSQPFQVSLLEKGYAQCHERSLNQTKYGDQFAAAEAKAKDAKVGLWKDYVEAVASKAPEKKNLVIKKKYYDVNVSEVLKDGRIAIQFLDSDKAKLKGFMQKFHAAKFAELAKPPRNGDIVAAKFSQNKKFYRARVLEKDRESNRYKIEQIDYGTVEEVPLSDLRSISPEFNTDAYKPQAHIVQLSLIRLPPESQAEYREDTEYYLEDRILDKQMVACSTFESPAPGVEMDVELYDPATIGKDANYSINKELVEKGYAMVKKHELAPFERLLKSEHESLLKLEAEAKRSHKGCWEYGDIEEEEEQQ